MTPSNQPLDTPKEKAQTHLEHGPDGSFILKSDYRRDLVEKAPLKVASAEAKKTPQFLIPSAEEAPIAFHEKHALQARTWFESLQDQICTTFESIEKEAQNLPDMPYKNLGEPGRFVKTPWPYAHGGGRGIMALMKGQVFEKVGVNVSTVWGRFPKFAHGHVFGTKNDARFFATGISLVAHMRSPHIPAIHMNTRHIVTEKSWVGGGADLTPCLEDAQEGALFHQSLQDACDGIDPRYYPKFRAWCDEYFYLPHRQEPRGIGGIFYDHLNSGNWEKDFNFTQAVGNGFLDIYPKLIQRKINQSWTEEERKALLHKRSRYVEFNLLYDRGTKFGLQTQGNTDAILMSLPPEVNWD